MHAGGRDRGRGRAGALRQRRRALELAAEEDAHVIVLAGEPIDEPIVQYGPFVMNTRQEIIQAVQDVSSGRFGKMLE